MHALLIGSPPDDLIRHIPYHIKSVTLIAGSDMAHAFKALNTKKRVEYAIVQGSLSLAYESVIMAVDALLVICRCLPEKRCDPLQLHHAIAFAKASGKPVWIKTD